MLEGPIEDGAIKLLEPVGCGCGPGCGEVVAGIETTVVEGMTTLYGILTTGLGCTELGITGMLVVCGNRGNSGNLLGKVATGLG